MAVRSKIDPSRSMILAHSSKCCRFAAVSSRARRCRAMVRAEEVSLASVLAMSASVSNNTGTELVRSTLSVSALFGVITPPLLFESFVSADQRLALELIGNMPISELGC